MARRWITRYRRAWWRSALREWVAQRHLDLSDLPAATRRLLIAGALLFLALSGAVVVNTAAAGKSPPFSATYAVTSHDWPAAVVLGTLAGLLATAALLLRTAATAVGGRRPLLVATAWLMAVVPPTLAASQVNAFIGVYEAAPAALIWSSASLAAAAVVTSLAGVVVAVRRPACPWALLVTAPLVLHAAAWAGARWTGARWSGPSDPRFPPRLPVSAAMGLGVVYGALAVAGVAMTITLWQAFEAVRASGDGARGAALWFARLVRASRRHRCAGAWTLAAALLGCKLVWVTLGLWGVLPRWLGGHLDLWREISGDGWLSWLLAGVAGGAAWLWTCRGCPAPSERTGLVGPVTGVVLALAIPEVAFQALAVVGILSADWMVDLARQVEQVQPWTPVVVIVSAGLAALWRWRSGRWNSGTLFLAAFGLWGLVRVPAMVTDLVRYDWFYWGISLPSEADYGSRPGWVGIATLDLAVTAALFLLAVIESVRKHPMRLVPFVQVAFATTIVVYPGRLVGVLLDSSVGNAAAFLLPFFYLFLFDSEGLNRRDAARERRVLTAASLGMLAVTVGLLRAYVHGEPVADGDVALATALLVVPGLVTTVVVIAGPLFPNTERSAVKGGYVSARPG